MRPVLESELARKRHALSSSRNYVEVAIWRDGDPGIENADEAGFITNTGPQGKRLALSPNARFWQNDRAQGTEQMLGAQNVSVTTWTFRFLQPDAPTLYADDEIHYQGRVWQVENPGGANSTPIYNDVQCVEITPGAIPTST